MSAEERTLIHDELERRYIIDKPQTGTVYEKSAVCIMCHGGGGNGNRAAHVTGFSDKIRSNGATAVYPYGTGKFTNRLSWNCGHAAGFAMENNIDDVGFISALIDTLVENDNADPERIFIAGMSLGGILAQLLGIKLSDKIAAIASVAGGLFGDEPKPAYPVSAMFINGAQDQNVPVEGGQPGGHFADEWDGTPLKPAAYQGTFWAAANGCGPTPEVTQTPNGALTIERYACPAGYEVEHIIVKDGGHAWPGGLQGSPSDDEPSSSLDATNVIWDFFMRQSK